MERYRVFQSTPSTRRATLAAWGVPADVAVSIHALHAEGDAIRLAVRAGDGGFNPRPPRGGRRIAAGLSYADTMFQSTPSTRRATACRAGLPVILTFQSTPSTRRATCTIRTQQCTKVCFNPRPPRGGRRSQSEETKSWLYVSIHALHAEGDAWTGLLAWEAGVSIHALHAEGDRSSLMIAWRVMAFQSTPSTRRATLRKSDPVLAAAVSIHALHAEGDLGFATVMGGDVVSIHALHAEGDASTASASRPAPRFNPRPPRGGRRPKSASALCHPRVSIHALHAEGDGPLAWAFPAPSGFNPRPPRGGRRAALIVTEGESKVSIHALHAEGDPVRPGYLVEWERFQSTPSTRRATAARRSLPARSRSFNPRPPRGGRPLRTVRPQCPQRFQSTPSTRRATVTCFFHAVILLFQSTPSTRRATFPHDALAVLLRVSIHALHAEGDLSIWFNRHTVLPFQSTPSTRRATSSLRGGAAAWGGFNPRPPRGGRLAFPSRASPRPAFQSTPSTRRATPSPRSSDAA